MRSIQVFGKDGPTGWRVLPSDADEFEESAFKVCALVKKGDLRIGKIPKTKLKSAKKKIVKKTVVKKNVAKKAAVKKKQRRKIRKLKYQI